MNDTYTVRWSDTHGEDHIFEGMQATSLAPFISALVIHPDMTVTSVTLDGAEPTWYTVAKLADAQLDDVALSRVEGSINP